MNPLSNRDPIRVVEGSAQPHARFWNWTPRNESDPASDAEIQFYGSISEYSWWGDEITPRKFAKDLAKYGAGGPITVRIHSGGGDLMAASAIRAMLAGYDGYKTVRIDGLCASAAVAVALAGDEIIIQDSAFMMIHNPGYTLLYGYMDAEYLRAISDDLDKFAESIIKIYARRTGREETEIMEMMAAETWMTADDAVLLGFADEIATGGTLAAVNPSVQNLILNSANPPDVFLNQVVNLAAKPQPAPTAEAESLSPPRLSETAAALRLRVQTLLNKEQADD